MPPIALTSPEPSRRENLIQISAQDRRYRSSKLPAYKDPKRPFSLSPTDLSPTGILNSASCFTEFFAAGNLELHPFTLNFSVNWKMQLTTQLNSFSHCPDCNSRNSD
jgi:hypothetical protein